VKEQSWWSNNLLPLSFVVLLICCLTAGVVGLLHWVSSAVKPARTGFDQARMERQNVQKRAATIDTASGDVYGPYMREIQRDIKMHWHPPKGDKAKRVTVVFKVDRQGRLSKLKVAQPTGNEELDQSARQAVEDTAPFPALPPESKDKDVDIQFTFDYNVYDKSRRVTH